MKSLNFKSFPKILLIFVLILSVFVILSSVSGATININTGTIGGIEKAASIVPYSENTTIILAKSVYTISNNTKISIKNCNITIKGPSSRNKATIDCKKLYFLSGSNSNITLINIIVKNGYSTKNDGTIYQSSGDLSILNCEFTSN